MTVDELRRRLEKVPGFWQVRTFEKGSMWDSTIIGIDRDEYEWRRGRHVLKLTTACDHKPQPTCTDPNCNHNLKQKKSK